MRTTPTGETEALGADLPSGAVVGEYRIDELIGRGGFGTVYRATHPLIGKQVAIKVLALRYSADPAIVSRFVAEAKAVNQIRHRNIIDIFAFGKLDDGRHYYVMEHLDGEPLDVTLSQHGPMPLADALPILRAVARALDAAHAKGIAHRDLKPENIFIARDPDGARYPKLLDFGIAKLLGPDEDVRHKTATGVPIGTPYYMSPEQCRGKDIDHRTDIYSFGIVAYRVLTGAYAFEGDDYMELLVKQVNNEPAPPSSKNPALPAAVDQAIAWMMRKNRDDRPQTVLAGVTAMDPAAITPDIPSTPMRKSEPGLGAAASATTDPFAKTTAGGDASTPPPQRRRRPWFILIPVTATAAIAAVVAWQVAKRASAPAETPRAAVTAPPPVPAAVPVPAPGAPAVPADAATPDHVTVDFTGVPDGASVTFAGTLLGKTPHVPIPYRATEIQVAVDAPGFEPMTVRVIPDHDQALAPKLTKKKARGQQRQEATDPDLIALPPGPRRGGAN